MDCAAQRVSAHQTRRLQRPQAAPRQPPRRGFKASKILNACFSCLLSLTLTGNNANRKMGARQLQLLLSCCRLRVSFSKFADRIGQRHQRRCKPFTAHPGASAALTHHGPGNHAQRVAERRTGRSPGQGMYGRGVAFWSVEKRALQEGGLLRLKP